MDTAVASADEVSNAILNENKKPTTPTRLELVVDDENWGKVLSYLADNKALGLDKLVKNLEQKYTIKATVKKELSKHLK